MTRPYLMLRFAPVWSLVLTAACASVSRRETRAPELFTERSYAFRPLGDTTLLFEAHPAAHLLLVDGLPLAYDRITRRDPQTGRPLRDARALRASVSPMFRIRQLRDSSAAVRTPSFMPRILAMEGLWVHGVGQPSGAIVRYDGYFVSGLRIGLTHHSNGQAGCFREGYGAVNGDPEQCVPRRITDTAAVLPRDTLKVRLNASDGDFSSTFLSVMVHSTYMADVSHGDTPRWTFGGAGAVEWHPPGIFGALTTEQRELYGGWRMRGQAEGMLVSGVACDDGTGSIARRIACVFRGRTRVVVEGERAPKAIGPLSSRFDPLIMPWRGSVELSHAFHWAYGFGPVIRWNDGQDYYNIGFATRRRVTMIGVMFDVGGDHLMRRQR